MDIDTQNHLTTLRELLTYRLHELQAEVHAAEQGSRDDGGSGDVTDLKDAADDELLSRVADAEERRDVDELARVECALSRLDKGTYGDCAQCGKPIPLQRLLVQPAAERCAGCQAGMEQGMKRVLRAM